jgi:hypothetical protein
MPAVAPRNMRSPRYRRAASGMAEAPGNASLNILDTSRSRPVVDLFAPRP